MGRAFLLGAFFSLIIGFISPFTVMVIQPMGMSADFITAGAIFCLLLIVGLLNPVLNLFKKPLSREEMVLIYSMMIVASAVPCWGFMLNLVPIISGLYYYATPENEWSELIHPYIKLFLAPQDRKAVLAFFEGLEVAFEADDRQAALFGFYPGIDNLRRHVAHNRRHNRHEGKRRAHRGLLDAVSLHCGD